MTTGAVVSVITAAVVVVAPTPPSPPSATPSTPPSARPAKPSSATAQSRLPLSRRAPALTSIGLALPDCNLQAPHRGTSGYANHDAQPYRSCDHASGFVIGHFHYGHDRADDHDRQCEADGSRLRRYNTLIPLHGKAS